MRLPIKKLLPGITALIILFAGVFVFRLYYDTKFHLEKQTRFIMDSYVSVCACGNKKIAEKAVNAALDRIQELDAKLSAYDKAGPIYRFNNQGIPLRDKEIAALVETAQEVSRQSLGAFDITTFPLTELWGFDSEIPRLPKEEEIKETLKLVGYQNIDTASGEVRKKMPGVKIDLGAIAEGYAVQEAIKVLKKEGIKSAIIDISGTVYALGKKGWSRWKVGIKDPKTPGLIGYVQVQDTAVIGGGDYEKFFVKDRKRYHHIFDPKTGYPAQGLTGITVIYADPVLADAWKTALFVAGPKQGMEFLKKIPGMEMIMVPVDGKNIYSAGFQKGRLKLVTE